MNNKKYFSHAPLQVYFEIIDQQFFFFKDFYTIILQHCIHTCMMYACYTFDWKESQEEKKTSFRYT